MQNPNKKHLLSLIVKFKSSKQNTDIACENKMLYLILWQKFSPVYTGLFLATIIAMIFGLKFLNTDETEKEEEIKEKIKENNKKIQEIETKVNETNKQIDKNLEHEQELSIKQNEIQTSIDVKYKDIDKQNKEFENQEQQIIDSSKNVDSNIDYLNSKYE